MQATFAIVLLSCFVVTGMGCVHFDNYAQFMRVAQTSTTAGPVITAEVVDTPAFEITHLLLGISKTSNQPPFALSFEAEDPAGQYDAMV